MYIKLIFINLEKQIHKVNIIYNRNSKEIKLNN